MITDQAELIGHRRTIEHMKKIGCPVKEVEPKSGKYVYEKDGTHSNHADAYYYSACIYAQNEIERLFGKMN